MKDYWQRIQLLLKIDYVNITNTESGIFNPFLLYPGIAPVLLHYGMFISAIERLGSDEQNKLWIPKARSLSILGCYAQTELGHGSNISGIETTATLDKNTDEWIIHSPTVTSTKFWAGGLGMWANHAVVFAQCNVDENNYGVMAFIVPLRDKETHKPL